MAIRPPEAYNNGRKVNMNKQTRIALMLVAAIAMLTGCTEAPTGSAKEPVAKAPAGPPEPIAAQSAFFEMYKPARTWAPDLLPLTLASGEIPEVKNVDGKAGRWTVVFVSPSKHEARTFVYSVADSGTDVRKGVNMGGSQPWSGPTAKSRTFQVTEFLTNSDAAYKTALQKAAPWVEKNPGKKVSLFLANATPSHVGPLWFVLWGDTKTGYLAHVNATTGTLVAIK